MRNFSRHSGFTLIELMIVVAVIAILAAIAYPSYQDSVRKTRRADAKASLMELAQTLERCFTEHAKYNHYVSAANRCSALASTTTLDASVSTSNDGYYAITIPTLTATTFTLTATPQGDQANDAKCATFSITHTGNRTATGTDAANCW